MEDFSRGDTLFDLPERPADGLGPLYTSDNCGACHRDAARGPGLVKKMSMVEADGFTPALDQSALAWGHTIHPLTIAPATTPIEPPPDPRVRVSVRLGPPLLGRGYLEAIDDAEIERNAAEEAALGLVHGRINRVHYASEANPDQRFFDYQKGDLAIGRFGIKARIATLDDFTADALAFDMGITSPLRPDEFPNPDGLLDDQKPGVDITADSLNARAMYVRLLEIPERSAGHEAGAELFTRVQCSACHVPVLHTRKDYPIAALADIDARIYSDLLLHDMGPALSDGMANGVDGTATATELRSVPLIGLRFCRSFLHDGRAASIREAIQLHEGPGSDANSSLARFTALSGDEQQALLDFVGSL